MLADTPLPHGFGAALASVDTFSKGSRTVRCLPALPCRLRAMGRNGLIEFLPSRQSFSAALQVARRVADHPPSTSFALLRTALCRSARNEGSRVLADRVTFSSVVKNLW